MWIRFHGFAKYVLGYTFVFLIRLMPWRPPNVEPILATLIPFSKRYGIIGGFLFGFLSIFLFDIFTHNTGLWTWITASTYGLLGIGAYIFFKRYKEGWKTNIIYSIIGTIFYDLVTGVMMGPLFFGQPLSEAFFGQIPFTLTHLFGNIALTLLLTPVIDIYIVENRYLESQYILHYLKKKLA